MKNTWKKTTSILAATGLLAGLLAGCASSSEPKQNATQNTGGHAKLVVWSHWKDAEFDALKKVTSDWAAKTGNEVTVQIDNGEFQSYATAARSGKGPDVLFGLPHDNLGTFAQAGLLAEVPSGSINDTDFEKVALDAITVNGKRVAYPMSMETYGMFYNTDKVKTAPTDWASFSDAATKNGFMFDINNFYFSYAFLSANGGYVFKNNNGTYDTNDIGLNNEGAIKGYTVLQDMVQKYKWMPADVTGDIAKAKFQGKNTAFYISGPWDVPAMKKAGINFAVAPLPTLDGGAKPKTFVGVQTAIVSSKSQNQQAAWDLLKYISDNGSKQFLDVGARIPVTKKALDDASFKANATANAFAQIAATGEPMPNIPAMQSVWTPEANNLKLLTTGKAAPSKVGADVVAQVKQGIATSK